MNAHAQMLAIATYCGWTDLVYRGVREPKQRDWIGHHPSVLHSDSTGSMRGCVPDYLGDEQAINQVVRDYLTKEEQYRWGAKLGTLVGSGGDSIRGRAYAHLALATAPQRCEAFLRVVEKWEEDRG